MRLVVAIALCLLSIVAVGVAAEPEISDDLLYDRVNRALITDRDLGTRQLVVKVENGEVVVTGFVETEKLQKKVDKVVKKVKGVKEVDNRVEVRL